MHETYFKTLKLYRNLLRAVSYFPDHFAQATIHKQIVFRFRKAQARFSEMKAKTHKMGYRSTAKSDEYRNRISLKLANGRQKLGVLTRATCGDPECFLKVLMLAYGRVGKRRRELIRALIEDDPESIPEDSETLLKFIHGDDKLEKLLESKSLRAGPKFNAFLKSQKTCQNKDVRDTIKELEPKVPKTNIWGRTLPRKRVATIKKDWWALVLKKMLPPVPRDEYERLKGLSLGKLPLPWLVSKRKPAILLNADSTSINTTDWINIFKYPLRELDEVEIDMVKFTDQGLQTDKNNLNTHFRLPEALGHKCIRSRRSLRRLYGRVWAMTATMSKDESTDKWIVEWGRGSSKYLAGEVTQPCSRDLELFHGMEDF